MTDFGPLGEYILLPVDIAVPNVARERFITRTVKRTHLINDARHFGGVMSGPTRGINAITRTATALTGMSLGRGPNGRRGDVGNPGPSQLLNSPGFRVLTLVPVLPGFVQINIDVRYWPDTPDDRPSLIIKMSDDLGIPADIETIAPAGGELGFVTISVPLIVSSIGVIECYRRGRSVRHDAYTFWDNLIIT